MLQTASVGTAVGPEKPVGHGLGTAEAPWWLLQRLATQRKAPEAQHAAAKASRNAENPPSLTGSRAKRMKGLEPSTGTPR